MRKPESSPTLEERIGTTLADLSTASDSTASDIAPQFLEFIAVALCFDTTGELARTLYWATLAGMERDEERVYPGMGRCYLEQLFRFTHARLINALDGEPDRHIWGEEEDAATAGFIATHLKDRDLAPLPWQPTGKEVKPEECTSLEMYKARHPPRPALLLGAITNEKGEPHEWIYGSKTEDVEETERKTAPKKAQKRKASSGVTHIDEWKKLNPKFSIGEDGELNATF